MTSVSSISPPRGGNNSHKVAAKSLQSFLVQQDPKSSSHYLATIPPQYSGEFYPQDAYVLVYTLQHAPEKSENDASGKSTIVRSTMVYIWIGHECDILTSEDAHDFSFLHQLLNIGMNKGGISPLDVFSIKVYAIVPQGMEPRHFYSLFSASSPNKALVIHDRGSMLSALSTGRSGEAPDKNGLYHIRSVKLDTSPNGRHKRTAYAECVPSQASSLNSQDCFFYIHDGTAYIWFGQHCSDYDRRVSFVFVAKITGENSMAIIKIKEGNEVPLFWEYLGGKSMYPSIRPQAAKDLSINNRPPVLFKLSAQDKYVWKKIGPNFTRKDLNESAMMILDDAVTGGVFFWIGSEVNESEMRPLKRARDIISTLSSLRAERLAGTVHVYRGLSSIIVRSGNEPQMFKNYFREEKKENSNEPSAPRDKASVDDENAKQSATIDTGVDARKEVSNIVSAQETALTTASANEGEGNHVHVDTNTLVAEDTASQQETDAVYDERNEVVTSVSNKETGRIDTPVSSANEGEDNQSDVNSTGSMRSQDVLSNSTVNLEELCDDSIPNMAELTEHNYFLVPAMALHWDHDSLNSQMIDGKCHNVDVEEVIATTKEDYNDCAKGCFYQSSPRSILSLPETSNSKDARDAAKVTPHQTEQGGNELQLMKQASRTEENGALKDFLSCFNRCAREPFEAGRLDPTRNLPSSVQPWDLVDAPSVVRIGLHNKNIMDTVTVVERVEPEFVLQSAATLEAFLEQQITVSAKAAEKARIAVEKRLEEARLSDVKRSKRPKQQNMFANFEDETLQDKEKRTAQEEIAGNKRFKGATSASKVKISIEESTEDSIVAIELELERMEEKSSCKESQLRQARNKADKGRSRLREAKARLFKAKQAIGDVPRAAEQKSCEVPSRQNQADCFPPSSSDAPILSPKMTAEYKKTKETAAGLERDHKLLSFAEVLPAQSVVRLAVDISTKEGEVQRSLSSDVGTPTSSESLFAKDVVLPKEVFASNETKCDGIAETPRRAAQVSVANEEIKTKLHTPSIAVTPNDSVAQTPKSLTTTVVRGESDSKLSPPPILGTPTSSVKMFAKLFDTPKSTDMAVRRRPERPVVTEALPPPSDDAQPAVKVRKYDGAGIKSPQPTAFSLTKRSVNLPDTSCAESEEATVNDGKEIEKYAVAEDSSVCAQVKMAFEVAGRADEVQSSQPSEVRLVTNTVKLPAEGANGMVNATSETKQPSPIIGTPTSSVRMFAKMFDKPKSPAVAVTHKPEQLGASEALPPPSDDSKAVVEVREDDGADVESAQPTAVSPTTRSVDLSDNVGKEIEEYSVAAVSPVCAQVKMAIEVAGGAHEAQSSQPEVGPPTGTVKLSADGANSEVTAKSETKVQPPLAFGTPTSSVKMFAKMFDTLKSASVAVRGKPERKVVTQALPPPSDDSKPIVAEARKHNKHSIKSPQSTVASTSTSSTNLSDTSRAKSEATTVNMGNDTEQDAVAEGSPACVEESSTVDGGNGQPSDVENSTITVKSSTEGTNSNSVKRFAKKFDKPKSLRLYSFEELKAGVPGIDNMNKERYLSPDEFAVVLGMTKEVYDALPKWKQGIAKKKAGLF